MNLIPSAIDPFSVQNSSLNYLRGTLGRSYMCREEQTLTVAQTLSINTFQVQVQPFGLKGDQFGAGKRRATTLNTCCLSLIPSSSHASPFVCLFFLS